jgi:hypothetical protein
LTILLLLFVIDDEDDDGEDGSGDLRLLVFFVSDDELLLFLADDLNFSFSRPSVNAESNFLLTDSAIDDTSLNIADCH